MTHQSIIEKVKYLEPGEAIHIGHSYLLINIAGIKIALDPSTETGFCSAPFCNLLPESTSTVCFLTPLIDTTAVIPRAEELAPYIHIVLYSHLHSDHFNGTVLRKMVSTNPDLKIIWSSGSSNILRASPKKNGFIIKFIIFLLQKLNLFSCYIGGISEYLFSDKRFDISDLNITEMKHGTCLVLSEDPYITIRALKVRHPKHPLYIKMPFEPSYSSQTLGYKVVYEENGERKSVLLIGETGTDSELLWNIWNSRKQLVAVFIPVADESTIKGIKLIKDFFMHSSLQIIALAERLSGDRTTIHSLHQGLWYYTMDENRVNIARNMLGSCRREVSEQEVEIKIKSSRKARTKTFQDAKHLLELIKTIGCFNNLARDKIKLNPPGVTFTYGQEKYS